MGSSSDRSWVQHVLIIKIAAIGDVAKALPLLTFFKEKNPFVKITWVVGQIAAPLVAATGLVDHLITIDEKMLFRGTVWQKGREVVAFWKKLQMSFFDLVITAHPDPRYLWLARGIRKREHRYFSRKQERPSPLPGRCLTQEYLRLASAENTYTPVFPKMQCTLPEHLHIFAEKAPVALAPGGAKNMLRDDALRRWPIENYAYLIKELSQKGIPVVVTGSESDAWVLPHFAGLEFDNLIGKTSILDLVAFYRHCRLLVAHDSGPLHLARLSPCRVIALFGPTNPREMIGDTRDVLWGGKTLGCSPCYDGKTYAPCQNNLCMKKISPQEVLSRIERACMTSKTSIPCMQ